MAVYYDNIDILPVFNWDKYIKSHNNNWLIKGFDGRQPVVRNDELLQIEKSITDQYYLELDDRDIFNRLQKIAKIDNIITKYNVIITLLNRCRTGFVNPETQHEFHKKLASLGLKIKTGSLPELAELYQKTNGLITQIKIIENELVEVKKGKSKGLLFQLKIIEKNLGFTVALNPKKLMLKEFIELCKEIENGE
jgi:hypothetical protein